MPCSEKKAQANRLNALKSTGPRSKPGKAKVALNAVRHGLRAEHLVLPGEDAAAFDAMLGAWMGDWKPPTDARRVLVEQATAHAWRLQRCLRAEREHLIEIGRERALGRRREAQAKARGAVARLEDDPARALEELLASRAGAEAVLERWRDLAVDATTEDWRDLEGHHHGLLHLLGLRESDPEADPEAIGGAVLASLRLFEWAEWSPPAIPWGRPPAEPEAGAVTQADAEAWAAELSAFLAQQVAEVEAYIASHFGPAEAEEAAEAARASASVVLDDSAEGRALLRYEGHHGRAFRATLSQLVKLTQTGADLVEDEPSPTPTPPPTPAETPAPPESVAQAAAVTVPPPVAPNKATAADRPAPSAPNKATEDVPPRRDGVGDAIADYLKRVGSSRSNR